MAEKRERYIPALRFRWLTPAYDAILKRGMREELFKRRLIAQAGIQPGHHVLDLGCGTGTLTILIKQVHPEAQVTGLDGDPEVLAIARAKARQMGVEITWEKGLAYSLPYEDNSFDRVLSSLVLHHLNGDQKCRAFPEILRVLRPGGELHVVDLGKPHNALMYPISLILRRFEEASDNIRGLLPGMFRQASFDPVEETARYMTLFGSISLYATRKPE